MRNCALYLHVSEEVIHFLGTFQGPSFGIMVLHLDLGKERIGSCFFPISYDLYWGA